MMRYVFLFGIFLGYNLTFSSNSKDLWLGFSFQTKKSADQKNLILDVQGLFPGSDAVQCGLEPGDQIVQMNGEKIPSLKLVKKLMQKVGEKGVIQLTVIRNQTEKLISIKPTIRPENIQNQTGSMLGSKVNGFDPKHFYENSKGILTKPKVTLLDFWATWCGVCHQSIPSLKKLYQKYNAKGFEIIGVSSEALPTLKMFQQQFKVPWPLYQDIGGLENRRFGVRGYPSFALLDEKGYVIKFWSGLPAYSTLEGLIVKQL